MNNEKNSTENIIIFNAIKVALVCFITVNKRDSL